MKIVDRKTFLALPEDVLFSKYQPCFFQELLIKGETLATDDFLVQQIADSIQSDSCENFSQVLHRAEATGESIDMDFAVESRDGCFEGPEVLFAIWEPADVEALIERLKRCATTKLPTSNIDR